jgi:hypothetical protein
VDDGVQVDALIAAIVAGNHTKGTITAWIMCPDDTGSYTIFGAGDADAAEYMYFINLAGVIRLHIQDGGTTRLRIDTASKVIKPHTWTHVAVVQNGSRPKMYINGEPVAMTDTTATELGQWFDDTDGIDGAHIGAADSISGDAALTLEYKGYISEFKIWSGTADTAALTAEQVKADYNGVTNTTSLLAYYNFDGSVVNTANPGTYDGTIVGDLIYCDANEFASRFSFGCGTPVTADNVVMCASNGFAFATVIQQA